MLDYHYRALVQHLRAENGGRDFGKARHVVGRVGKHHIERGRATVDETQRIATHETEIVGAELLRHTLYERTLHGGFLHGRDLGTTARQKLETHGSRARKKVESAYALKVDYVFENVENVLARKIGGRAGRYVAGHIETPAPVFSSDYSHNIRGCLIIIVNDRVVYFMLRCSL